MLRLRAVLSDSDLLSQVMRGVPLLLLAAWIAAPWDAFQGMAALAHLLQWAPRPAWVLLSIGIALLHFYSVYSQAWYLRQVALMGSFLWWLLLVVLAVTDEEAWRPFTALVLAQAITAFVFYVRLGTTLHIGSMVARPHSNSVDDAPAAGLLPGGILSNGAEAAPRGRV